MRTVLEAGGQAALPALSGLPSAATPALPTSAEVLRPMAARIAELEHSAIAEALMHTGGNRTAAARLLGISRASLYDRLDAMKDTPKYQTIV